VNRVVAAAELDGTVDAWARRLADGPPLALSMTKDDAEQVLRGVHGPGP
jgi:enoyl-CoA hydratase/carnithine racemase